MKKYRSKKILRHFVRCYGCLIWGNIKKVFESSLPPHRNFSLESENELAHKFMARCFYEFRRKEF